MSKCRNCVVECKNCKSENTTKNGIVRAKQRYKCKDCGYNFVIGHAHHSPQKKAKKAMAVMLYSLGKGSFTMLAHLFGVSNGTVYNWVAEAARGLPEPTVNEDIAAIEFDEMWHYIGKKNESCGSSKQLTERQREQLRGCLEAAVRKLSNDSTPK